MKAWSRHRRITAGLVSAVVLILVVFGPLLVNHDPTRVVGDSYLPPSGKYWFGTDNVGLDVFSRTISATRLDVYIGLAITLSASLAGCVAGIAIGMVEHRRDVFGLAGRSLARAAELTSALPSLLVALAVVSIAGSNTTSIILSIAASLTPNLIRLVRTEVLAVRVEAYLDAARQAGMSETRLMVRHVFPNAAWPAVETFSLTFGSAVMVTAALGFLGIGVPLPTPEWGSMISAGVPDISLRIWWTTLIPAAAMALTVAAIAYVVRPARIVR
jgi:peptide/nickel transport system permease protein